MCRRPFWKRGIIRKKKNQKKETEEEEEEEQEAEVEAAGPSDSCLTQDEESSCDTPGPQPNGHLPHAPSTEEESSSEPPVIAEGRKDPKAKEEELSAAQEGKTETPEKRREQKQLCGASPPNADEDRGAKKADFPPLTETFKSSDAQVQPKHTEDLRVSQVDCMNGTESMDSVDLHSPKRSNEADIRTPLSSAEGCNKPEQEEHKDKNESKATQEQHPLDDGAVTQTVEEDQGKEDGSREKSSLCIMSEQLTGSAGRTNEEPEPVPTHPPVVVDHQRLLVLLDMVVKKSEGYSVEQLERLYSHLSQCIYQHRREYDKTRLLEEMEERIQHFDTFL